jgi:hypothetical protein
MGHIVIKAVGGGGWWGSLLPYNDRRGPCAGSELNCT